jgi:3',5'-cyclic AMP phosphodiesterase CpdA
MTREPTATHRIGHVSDSHFTRTGLLHDEVATGDTFHAALVAIEASGIPIDALVHTGDVADDGEPASYESARTTTRAVTDRTGWPVLWTPGNHDVREPFARQLLDLPGGGEPLDRVVEVRGLRIVLLDTSIPRRVEGGFTRERADRLREWLAEPAEHGTVLALHHPPVPVEVTGLQRLHLTGQDELLRAIEGTDVRAVLGGHLHYSTTSLFGGVPVFVAPATAYVIRLTRQGGGVLGADGGRAAGVLSLYDDGRVGYSLLATDPVRIVAETPDAVFDAMGVDVER